MQASSSVAHLHGLISLVTTRLIPQGKPERGMPAAQLLSLGSSNPILAHQLKSQHPSLTLAFRTNGKMACPLVPKTTTQVPQTTTQVRGQA